MHRKNSLHRVRMRKNKRVLRGISLGANFIVVLIGLAFFGDFFESSDESSSQKEPETEGGLEALPNIMYDSNNARWQLQHRNYDHVVYHDDNGNIMRIRNANVSRGNIQTDQGFFHSY